jgi:hypothetical protein
MTIMKRKGEMTRHRVFLSIAAGPDPTSARPILATEDRFVVKAAFDAFRYRLGLWSEPVWDVDDPAAEGAVVGGEPEGIGSQ